MDALLSQHQVFISYAREDITSAEKIYHYLKKEGIKSWMDVFDIKPGQNWELEIYNAIRNSSFFLALLSSHSISKKGYIQKELKIALDLMDYFPTNQIFIIPVRLDKCNPVDVKLQKIHWIDLFLSFNEGLQQLLQTVKNEYREIEDINLKIKDEDFYHIKREDINKLNFNENDKLSIMVQLQKFYKDDQVEKILNEYSIQMNKFISNKEKFPKVKDLYAAHDASVLKAFVAIEPDIEPQDVIVQFLKPEVIKERKWEDSGLNDEQENRLNELIHILALNVNWIRPIYIREQLENLDEVDLDIVKKCLNAKKIIPDINSDLTRYLWNNYYFGGRSDLWIYVNVANCLKNKYKYISKEEYIYRKKKLIEKEEENIITFLTGYELVIEENIDSTIDHLLNAFVMEHLEDYLKGKLENIEKEAIHIDKQIPYDLRDRIINKLAEKGLELSEFDKTNEISYRIGIKNLTSDALVGLLLEISDMHRNYLIKESFPELEL